MLKKLSGRQRPEVVWRSSLSLQGVWVGKVFRKWALSEEHGLKVQLELGCVAGLLQWGMITASQNSEAVFSPCTATPEPWSNEINIWPEGKGEMFIGSGSSVTNQGRETRNWNLAQRGTPVLDLVSLPVQATFHLSELLSWCSHPPKEHGQQASPIPFASTQEYIRLGQETSFNFQN